MADMQQEARFAEKLLPVQYDAIAPDGSRVRLLLRLPAGSMAHFELAQAKCPVRNGIEQSVRFGTSYRAWGGCGATRMEARIGRLICGPAPH
jgi:hypothetical protein